MKLDDLTIGQAKELARMFSPGQPPMETGLIGKYVIVRCRDAGVHAGVLETHHGRECVLTESRRLWYWKPKDGKSFLSGVATAGLHEDSKVGSTLPRIHLTENCEILECSQAAENSIQEAKEHVQ